jgi:prepilin signal peptidase PulO-like enzyme (type II secretory pathway)
MGGGDVAMMAMVGGFLGWQSVLATIFGGACVGVVLHVGSLALARQRHPVPAGAVEPAKVPVAASAAVPAPAPPAPTPPVDPEFKTRDELHAEGYLPFGVSLAIAAGLIVLVDAREPIVAWFAAYAKSLGL